jgi:hypothetical protein
MNTAFAVPGIWCGNFLEQPHDHQQDTKEHIDMTMPSVLVLMVWCRRNTA